VHARPRGTGACAASGSSAASATRCNPRHGRAHLGEQGRGVCTRAPGPMTGPERSAERSERSERSEQSQAQPKARVRAPRGTGPSTRARYTAVRAQGARFTSLVAPSTVPLASNLGHIPARAVARRAAPGAPLVAFSTLPRDLNLGLAPSTCACDSTARARAVGRRPPARPRAPRPSPPSTASLQPGQTEPRSTARMRARAHTCGPGTAPAAHTSTARRGARSIAPPLPLAIRMGAPSGAASPRLYPMLANDWITAALDVPEVTVEVNLRLLKPRVFARGIERPETRNMGWGRDAAAGRRAGAGREAGRRQGGWKGGSGGQGGRVGGDRQAARHPTTGAREAPQCADRLTRWIRRGAARRGVARCGAVRRGTARCGAARCGAVWRGAARRGAVRGGAVRRGAARTWQRRRVGGWGSLFRTVSWESGVGLCSFLMVRPYPIPRHRCTCAGAPVQVRVRPGARGVDSTRGGRAKDWPSAERRAPSAASAASAAR